MRLRVKDLDFANHQIIVREGKGENDRVTMFPGILLEPLRLHLKQVKAQHELDLSLGYGTVYLPYALERKYLNANREFAWQYIFPAPDISTDPITGIKRRHHLNEANLQRAVKQAARLATMDKPVTPHTFRHRFATHLLENGYDTQHLRSGQVFAPFRSFSGTRPALSLSKGCEDHDDLHSCASARWTVRQESP